MDISLFIILISFFVLLIFLFIFLGGVWIFIIPKGKKCKQKHDNKEEV